MHNNPEKHRFQYSMMAGVRINRNNDTGCEHEAIQNAPEEG
jgi:hypothetical protein